MSYDHYGFDAFFDGAQSSPTAQQATSSPRYSFGSREMSRDNSGGRRNTTGGINEGSSYSMTGTGYMLPQALQRTHAAQPQQMLQEQPSVSAMYGGVSEYGDMFAFLQTSPGPTPLHKSSVKQARSGSNGSQQPSANSPQSNGSDQDTAGWAFGIQQCSSPSYRSPQVHLPAIQSSPKAPTPPSGRKGTSAPTLPRASIGGNALQPGIPKKSVSAQAITREPDRDIQPLMTFHQTGQQPTPNNSPKRDGRGMGVGIPSFRTWQKTRDQGNGQSPGNSPDQPQPFGNARMETTLHRRRREKRLSGDKGHGNEAGETRVSPAPANWLSAAAEARRRSSGEDGKGRGPRVTIDPDDVDIDAPLSALPGSMIMPPRRPIGAAPPFSAEEPVDGTRRRPTAGAAPQGAVQSSLIPHNRLADNRLSLSASVDQDVPLSAERRQNGESSIMAPSRQVFLTRGQRGLMCSLIAHGRGGGSNDNSVSPADSVDITGGSAGIISLEGNTSNGSMGNLRHSVDGTYNPHVPSSRRVSSDEEEYDKNGGGGGDDDDDGPNFGQSSHMPSMFRRSHTRRASTSVRASINRGRRLTRTESHTWLAGLGASTTVAPNASFSYMKRASVTRGPSGSDDDEGGEGLDDSLSIHSSEDDSVDISSEEDDSVSDDAVDASEMAAARNRGNTAQPVTRSHPTQAQRAPDMSAWRPTHRVPLPQPNLPLHVGRGGCLSINPMARTPQPSVGRLLGFNLETHARRVPSPDWGNEGMAAGPGMRASPGMMANPMMMGGRGMY